jgi:hypothetical protein
LEIPIGILKTLTTSTLISCSSFSALAIIVDKKQDNIVAENTRKESEEFQNKLQLLQNNPSSSLFDPLDIASNFELSKIDSSFASAKMAEAVKREVKVSRF